jgi:glycosyltransferase involved in cell wall biosynthesis
LAVHRAIGTFDRGITRYVALTPFQRSLMVRGGIDADRISVIPNFLEPDPGQTTDDRSGFVFAGRLSVEKGIRPLLTAARSVRGMVRLAGTGPLLPMVEEATESGEVRYLGALDRPGVIHHLRRSTAMVIPSVWFEGFPLTVVEAFATATPVIASAIGSLGEIIEDGLTGLLARPGDADDLADRLRWAWENPDRMRAMGLAARQRYERLYRGDSHLTALEFLYRELADVSSPLPGA